MAITLQAAQNSISFKARENRKQNPYSNKKPEEVGKDIIKLAISGTIWQRDAADSVLGSLEKGFIPDLLLERNGEMTNLSKAYTAQNIEAKKKEAFLKSIRDNNGNQAFMEKLGKQFIDIQA